MAGYQRLLEALTRAALNRRFSPIVHPLRAVKYLCFTRWRSQLDASLNLTGVLPSLAHIT
eukprot:6929388-Prymnesium_polylepis.2